MLHRSIVTLALVISVLGLAGCASPPQPEAVGQPASASTQYVPVSPTPGPVVATPSAAAVPWDRLYVRAGDGRLADRVLVLDGAGGTGERELPFGVPAPDWSVLYTAVPLSGKTIVRAIDPTSGRALRQTTLDGEYSLPATTLDGTLSGLSPNGKWLALAELPVLPDPLSYGLEQRRQSGFVVLDTMFAQPARPLLLDGNFSFDALSNSGRALYLIEHLPPERPDQYRVRRYDLQADVLDERIIADKRAAPQLMEGTRHSSLASRDGSWLYSVYLNPRYGPFIHALNLNDGFAFCIFLPPEGKEDWAKQLNWSVVMSKSGALYAVNGALGIVAEVDPSQVNLRRTATLPTSAAADPSPRLAQLAARNSGAAGMATGGAALSPDGKTLWAAGATGLLAIDTRDFSPRGQYLADRTFESLALSPDGERVYAVDAGRNALLRIDAASGTVAGELPGLESSSQVLRIETQP